MISDQVNNIDIQLLKAKFMDNISILVRLLLGITHNYATIGSDNDLSPGRCQAII